MKDHTDADTCNVCGGIIPIGGRHNIVLDSIKMTACEMCFKSIVAMCIQKIHLEMRDV